MLTFFFYYFILYPFVAWSALLVSYKILCYFQRLLAAKNLASFRSSHRTTETIPAYDPFNVSAGFINGNFGTEHIDDQIIHGVLRLEKSPTKQQLIDLFRSRNVLKHKAFCCIPQTVPSGSYNMVWTSLEHLNVSKLFIEHTSKNNTSSSDSSSCCFTKQEADELVEKICNDNTYIRKEGKELPWWRMHIIREENNQTRLVLAIHHAICDGLACIRVFLNLLDADENGTRLEQDEQMLNFSPTSRNGAGTSKSNDPLGRDIRGIAANLLKPRRWPRAIIETLDFVLCAADWAYQAVVAPADTQTPLHFGSKSSTSSVIQQIFDFDPSRHQKIRNVMVPMPVHSLELIKKIKNAASAELNNKSKNNDNNNKANVTVNDVEFGLYAGMMRRYLEKYGKYFHDGAKGEAGESSKRANPGIDLSSSAKFRALTPFNIPMPIPSGKEFTNTTVNTWCFQFNELPVSEKSAKDRLIKSHKNWQPIKKRSYVPAAFEILEANGKAGLPLFWHRFIVRMIFARNSVIFSNLPGPSGKITEDGEPSSIYFCGCKILSVNAYHPTALPMAIIVSMNGQMHYSLTVPMNEELTRREGTEADVKVALPKMFLEELDELRTQLGV